MAVVPHARPAGPGRFVSALRRRLLFALAAGDPDAARRFVSDTGDTFATGDTSQAGEATPPHLESFEAFFRHYEQDIFGYLWRMTGEERLAIALELHELSCNVAREGIRHQNPNVDEAEVERLLHQRLALARQ